MANTDPDREQLQQVIDEQALTDAKAQAYARAATVSAERDADWQHQLDTANARARDTAAASERLTDAVERAQNLCRLYIVDPPPIYHGPGLSDHAVGYNQGARDLAAAVLDAIRGVLNTGPLCTNRGEEK